MTVRWITAGLCAAALLGPPSAPALEVLLQEDRLSLKANRDKLTEILEEFAHAGVTVHIDPAIEAYVTGELDGEDVQQALDALLEHFSYVLVWDVIEGPMGSLAKLDEIRIFKPDKGNRNLRPLEQDDGNLTVTHGPSADDPLFVSDEVLLSVKRGTNIEAFRALLREIGGSVVSSIPHLGIYRIRVPRGTNIMALIDQLRMRDMIATVEPNYAYRLPPPTAAKHSGAPVTSTPGATALLQGAPPVAVLDSGLQSVAGLEGMVVGELDALKPTRAITDHSGHGTQMALIASGAVQPSGVPADLNGVPVLAIRAFDDAGYASNFSLMNSIDYAITKGARVLSMSWGTETDSDFLQRAISDAQRRGMVVVAAAGNEPHGRPVYPAAYPGVIGVSAMNTDGSLWDKSNYGTAVYAAAPGHANFPVGHEGPPGSYAGTSIGAPYVAREVSKYLAAKPDATANDVARDFRKALTDAGDQGKDSKYGYGAFDAAAVKQFQNTYAAFK